MLPSDLLRRCLNASGVCLKRSSRSVRRPVRPRPDEARSIRCFLLLNQPDDVVLLQSLLLLAVLVFGLRRVRSLPGLLMLSDSDG